MIESDKATSILVHAEDGMNSQTEMHEKNKIGVSGIGLHLIQYQSAKTDKQNAPVGPQITDSFKI